MKPIIKALRVGQKVWATIEESVDKDVLIVNFSGDLLRVANQTHRNFRTGQRVQLNVVSVEPLSFKFVEARTLRPLDVEV